MNQDKTEFINKAINHVKFHGLTEEQIEALFKDEASVSTREALLISHIQFLENRMYGMLSVLEEIAALENNSAGQLAQITLEKLSPTRQVTNK